MLPFLILYSWQPFGTKRVPIFELGHDGHVLKMVMVASF